MAGRRALLAEDMEINAEIMTGESRMPDAHGDLCPHGRPAFPRATGKERTEVNR